MKKKVSVDDKVKLCLKCGSATLVYDPGIDIGLIYAKCVNCGYKANSNMFPDISKKEASKIKVIKGNKLLELQSKNILANKTSKWIGIIILFVMLTVFITFLL